MLKINLINENAKMPTRAYKGDVGLDVYCSEDITIKAKEHGEIKLGVSLDIPEGFWVQVQTRSSMARKGIQCHAGVIDETFKGELSLFTFNHSSENLIVSKGEKVAQLILHKVYDDGIQPQILEARGERGYGSSNHV